MLHIRQLRLFILVFMLLILAACQGFTIPSQFLNSVSENIGEAQDLQVDIPDIGPIKIGYQPLTSHTPMIIAQEKGYFAAQGLEVELIYFRNITEMVPLLASGDLDIAIGSHSANLFNAMGSGMPIKLIGGVTKYPEGWEEYYAIRKELFDSGEVTEFADLSGRKIAINAFGTFGEFLLMQLLAQADLSIDDVELVTLPPSDMSLAMANGAVDVATIWGPIAERSFADGVSVPLTWKFETSTQIASFVAGKRLLDSDNQEITIRVLTAVYKTLQEELTGPDYLKDEEISHIVQKYTDLPLAVINNTRPNPFIYDGKVDAESINRVQSYFWGRGYLDYSELLSTDEIVDESFLNEAFQRLEQSRE